MGNKYDVYADRAAAMTDAEFKNKFATLTRLNMQDLEKVIKETGISQQDLAELLKEVKSASTSNEKKAMAISNSNKGVTTLIALVKTFL